MDRAGETQTAHQEIEEALETYVTSVLRVWEAIGDGRRDGEEVGRLRRQQDEAGVRLQAALWRLWQEKREEAGEDE